MATQKSQDKWKNKRWFNIYAPKVLGGEEVIGEMPAADEKAAMGRIIKVSLSWITKNPNNSLMSVGLRVHKADGNVAHTQLHYLESNYSYIHSLVRRYSSAIYTRDIVKDKDGKEFTLKMLVIASGHLADSKKSGIRKKLTEFVTVYSAKHTADELVKGIIDGSMQAEGRKGIENIAHVNKFELKKIEF